MIDPSSRSGLVRSGAALVLIGTFVLGMIAGAALLHIARLSLRPPAGQGPRFGPPPRPGEPPVEHLRHELDLDQDQVTRLRSVIEESRKHMRGEADATRERIREILTPAQRTRFDAMRPPPPPPPPGFGPPPGFPPPPPPPRNGDPEPAPPPGG